MDMYEAKHDYTRERDDVLSFTKGEKFYITKKTTEKWWLAKKIEDDTYGYVPSVYLKQSTERIIGRLIPECRRDTEEHKIHLLALAEIHQKIKPLPVPPPPMASPPPPDYDMEDDSKDRNDMPYHHKFNSSGRYSSLSSEESSDLSPTSPAGEEPFLIKPKPLPNPVKDSKEHKQLHRELRMSYRTGGPLPQKSELSQVNRERRLGEKKKEEENDKKSRRTSMEIKLLERQEKERMEEEKVQKIAQMKEQDAIAEERKPEFMKVRLKQTNSYPKS